MIARLSHTIDRNAQRKVLSEPLTPDLDTNRPFPTNEAEVTCTTPRAEAVDALNRTLHTSEPQNSKPASSRAFDYEKSARQGPKQLIDLSDIAFLSRLNGNYKEAERLYKQGLIRRRKQLGDHHPKVAIVLRSLASLYCVQNRHTEAEVLLKQALVIQQTRLGTGHIETAETLHKLANLYRHQERYSKADTLFQSALESCRRHLGKEHPYTQAVYSDLMAMMATLITQDKFAELMADVPPLDLNTLSDTYSWAKPQWQRQYS
ncbi:MAG: tetratricopeptide repeat protein [Cyanobacteria bacterium P01_A01_bin.116]